MTFAARLAAFMFLLWAGLLVVALVLWPVVFVASTLADIARWVVS